MPPLFRWGQILFRPVFKLYQKDPKAGAYTTVHVATAPELRGVGGRLVGDGIGWDVHVDLTRSLIQMMHWGHFRRYFVNCEPTNDVHRLAYDRVVGKRLWELSEECCQTALNTK